MSDPQHELPPAGNCRANPGWNETAGLIGGALGRAVKKVVQLPHRAEHIPGEIRQRLEDVRAHGRDRSAGVVTRLRQAAERQTGELKGRARENIRVVRNRANRLVRERPVGIIVSAFVTAFVVGAVLRVGRSSRD